MLRVEMPEGALRVWVSLRFDFLVCTDAYRTRSAP